MEEAERRADRMSMALLPGVSKTTYERRALSLSERRAVARYMRNPRTWGVDESQPDSAQQGEALIRKIVQNLKGHILISVVENGAARGARLLSNALDAGRRQSRRARPCANPEHSPAAGAA